jgi:hypothetical protein
MVRNIALAVAAVLVICLGILCLHFYNVAEEAKQQAIIERLRAEEAESRQKVVTEFLGSVLAQASPAQPDAGLRSRLDQAALEVDSGDNPTVEAAIRGALERASE